MSTSGPRTLTKSRIADGGKFFTGSKIHVTPASRD